MDETLNNPKVKEWFNGDWDDVRVETNIAFNNKMSRRPDRVMIKGDRVVVVDYKFGRHHRDKHNNQVRLYMSLLAKMGCYKSIEGYVWYVMLGDVIDV